MPNITIFTPTAAPSGNPISAEISVRDRTSAERLTGSALAMWQAMVAGAERAGLSRIVMTAGGGEGHLSHGQGTEIDLVAYNADGSRWTGEQRVAVAAAAAAAGGNRFGFYSRDGASVSSLHVGLGYEGAPRNVAWGPGGQTDGVSVNGFRPEERAFVASLRNGNIQTYLETTGRNVDLIGTSAPGDIKVELGGGNKSDMVSDDKPLDAGGGADPRVRAATPALSNIVTAGGLLRQGMSGAAVHELQHFLNDQGYRGADGRRLTRDSEFGPNTAFALRAYQSANATTADAVVGPNTFGKMTADLTGADTGPAAVVLTPYTPPPPLDAIGTIVGAGRFLAVGQNGDAVLQLQTWLNDHGITDRDGNALEVDGDFGAKTRQALAKLQESAGETVDGILGTDTLDAMRELDAHEERVTTTVDVNDTRPRSTDVTPVAADPYPDTTVDYIPATPAAATDLGDGRSMWPYDQPDPSAAAMAQYEAEKTMVTPSMVPAARTDLGVPEMPVESSTRTPAQIAQSEAEKTMVTERAPVAAMTPVRAVPRSAIPPRRWSMPSPPKANANVPSFRIPVPARGGSVGGQQRVPQYISRPMAGLPGADARPLPAFPGYVPTALAVPNVTLGEDPFQSYLTDAQIRQYAEEAAAEQAVRAARVVRGLPPAAPAATDLGDGRSMWPYDQPVPSTAAMAQYEAEKTMVTEPVPLPGNGVATPVGVVTQGTLPAVPPLPGNGVATPVGAVTQGALGAVQPQMGTRFQGDAGVPGMGAPANGLGPSAGQPPDASRLSPMEPPAAPPVATRPNLIEAMRAMTEQGNAEAEYGRKFGGLSLRELRQVPVSSLTADDLPAYQAAMRVAVEADQAETARRLGLPVDEPAATPAERPAPGMGRFAGMPREQMLEVDPTILTLPEMREYSARMDELIREGAGSSPKRRVYTSKDIVDALAETGPAWLRGQLEKTGVPRQQLAATPDTDLIRTAFQKPRRFVPNGMAALADIAPIRNTPLAKLRVLGGIK
tara:strand:+ start:14926 stop:17943 length:3018 start_codon:yes stop_codon:yes gene_type:complete